MGAHKLGEGQVDLSSNSYSKFPNTKEFPENHRHWCHAKLRQDVLNWIGCVCIMELSYVVEGQGKKTLFMVKGETMAVYKHPIAWLIATCNVQDAKPYTIM